MDAEELALWAKRTEPAVRNALYMRYAEAIDRTIEGIITRFALPTSADVHSLAQAGRIGAMQAITRFDPSCNVKFMTFAVMRIRGAMLDELRNSDIPRKIRRSVTERLTAEQVLMEQLQREPTPEEVCDCLGWDRKQYLLSTMRGQNSLDRLAQQRSKHHDRASTAADMVESSVEHNAEMAFRDMCRGLTIEQQTLLYLYYWRGVPMKKVGEALGLSESRISQMHSQLMIELRSRGNEYFHIAMSA